ncbi:hypothetical protein [Streptomyces goshikiensis]|uniref:hypothetical protein n=1 Tax=Streptomyces goshikiensis TaxID=1942 RepID=UPI002E11CBF6|nr:hypothetical protein OG224_06760 [Streptomyces goshikiensis]
MFTGTPEELRRLESQAAELGAKVADLLNRMEALKAGSLMIGMGRINGFGFVIHRRGNAWSLER